ncbi:unnamed protein product [Penicillium roqueforti FM164]|uniref:Genomic scaffold, ProqFM164S01 n=1 Tax=Penicillium roqueforti (strain FM164) TaxID=1365484 RepID=W6PY94_PENRF|nr:unnamed protein product [Penicillium roqueforti FM164]
MEREGCGLGVMDYFGWCHSVGDSATVHTSLYQNYINGMTKES